MFEVDEKTERLINRSLDNELSAEEQLDLDRELIRNPAARRMFEVYAGNDRLAAAELDRALSSTITVAAVVAQEGKRRAKLHPRVWWILPGAIAAALLAMIVPYPEARRPTPSGPPPVVSATRDSGQAPWDSQFREVGHSLRATPLLRRDTGREVIGVVGDDGNLYWIEVERTRTTRLPPQVRPQDSL